MLEVAPSNDAVFTSHSGDTPRMSGAGATSSQLSDRSDRSYVPESPLAASPGGLFANNFEELTPKRRWLAKQELELQQFAEELEQADIGTPVNGAAPRGRMAMRRVRQPMADTPRTPRAGEAARVAALTTRAGLLGLLGSPRTPRQDDGSGTKVVDPSDAMFTYNQPVRTPNGPATKRYNGIQTGR